VEEQEVLVILDPTGAERAARDIDGRMNVVHRMPRVLVVRGGEREHAELAGVPGVAHALARGAAPPATPELSEGERLFVRAWLGRAPKQRRGDGSAWDAPGYTPPG
jgi:hypothetical protein